MKILISAISLLILNSAFALPIESIGITRTKFSNITQSEFDFLGTIGLNNCSGSIIKLVGSSESDKALLLTNGHCIGMGSFQNRFPSYGEVITSVDSVRDVNLLDEESNTVGEVKTTKLLYGTMTNTDMAIYELDLNYRKLKRKYNIEPLTLSENSPVPGDQVEIISGYWKKGFNCEVDKVIPKLKEMDWIWTNSFRYKKSTECDTYGGTSGSPVVDTLTQEVVAIHNTGNDDGELCTMMNPCEMYPNGDIIASKDSGYSQNTSNVYTCLNSEMKIDLNLDGCLLPKN